MTTHHYHTLNSNIALPVDNERRFSGTARLLGNHGLEKLRQAHVVIVGLGGVGSWTAECLARSGIGALTLIDLDVIAISNVNRQIHATDVCLGANKVDAMKERILSYAPHCRVNVIDDWITPDNVAELIPINADVVIDCIDQVLAKVALIVVCKHRKQPLIVCGAAGGKTDVSKLNSDDLVSVTHDPLLASVRSRLRKIDGFKNNCLDNNKKPSKKIKRMNIQCIYSSQPIQKNIHINNDVCETPQTGQGLNCAGYGSMMHITATMGLWAASKAIDQFNKP